MATKTLSHTAEDISAAVSDVLTGDVVIKHTEDSSLGIAPGVKAPVSGEVLYAAMEDRQLKLEWQTLSNGNHQLFEENGQRGWEYPAPTPSGSPLHDAFVAMGAEYNDSDTYTLKGVWGDTITHEAGRWLYNEIGDLTNAEMANILVAPQAQAVDYSHLYGGYTSVRTNRLSLGTAFLRTSPNLSSAFCDANKIEVINLWPAYTYRPGPAVVRNAFAGCTSLRKILNIINVTGVLGSEVSSMFIKCGQLSTVMLQGIAGTIDFSANGLLNKASLIYMIKNSRVSNETIITLHPKVYTTFASDIDVVAELSLRPWITLAS